VVKGAYYFRSRKKMALPLMGNCTLHSVAVTVGVFVTVSHEGVESVGLAFGNPPFGRDRL
jgi:hypothetical protein